MPESLILDSPPLYVQWGPPCEDQREAGFVKQLKHQTAFLPHQKMRRLSIMENS